MAKTKNEVTLSFAPTSEHDLNRKKCTFSEQTFTPKNIPLDDLFEDLPECPTIGSLLKESRIRSGLTQSALSELTDITTAELSRLEADKILKPSKEVLIALAPYIGYPYTYLLLCAGYSGVYIEEIYYNKAKEKIPHKKITADIYNADSELLELLSDINKLSNEDIKLLKMLIYIFKRTAINTDNSLSSYITKLVKSIKTFLQEQLAILINLLNVCCQRS